MQRKQGFPAANCNIKMPDGSAAEANPHEEEGDHQQKRQHLINFGHSQWGFNNWSWSVTKEELDFVDFANGKFCAGVVAFVAVTVKKFDIHRENIGYATSTALNKGTAIYMSRKCAVTNALRETLLSFGGNVASELMESLEAHRSDYVGHAPAPTAAIAPAPAPAPEPAAHASPAPGPRAAPPPVLKNGPNPPPPVAMALPMPCAAAHALPPAANCRPPPRAAPAPRPPSNVSYVLHPVPARPPPYPPYYEYAGPWHFAYESFDRPPGNVNLNFNVPPKNLASGREGEPHPQYGPPPPSPGCWVKPTIFYDGFWTEQKVKNWVAEQVEKQFPENPSRKSSSPGDAPPPKP